MNKVLFKFFCLKFSTISTTILVRNKPHSRLKEASGFSFTNYDGLCKRIFRYDIVHLKLVSHISPRSDISVSQTVQMISVQNGWGPREMVWCQNETNLDVVG